ncbi:hypothetical protein WILDE_57 [Arthrobacter phage Wilde]|uniref:Uncharacterized protein n=1 Tax=Arthrobacter phage Wilde TaxID=1772323 RepID=A0A0U3TNX1_9CAUD|nr:hypothetical protein WILDE_57 [Arthrobacter phage Wilde]
MTEEKPKAPAKRKPATRKPAARKAPAKPRASRAKKVEEVKEPGMRIALTQRPFDESAVELKHVVVGGGEPVALITVDFVANEIHVDATRLTLEDMHNLFTALANSTNPSPDNPATKQFT